jgi:membrane protein YqaA with SNARE-associated domain
MGFDSKPLKNKRLKNLYIWSLELAKTKWATWVLFISSFADASILPLPITTIFLMLILINAAKANRYVLFSTSGTLAGAFAGYVAGHFAWYDSGRELTVFAHFLFTHIPGFSEVLYNQINVLYSKLGFWILFIASFTPLPYGIFSISSGVFDINIIVFLCATLISQGIKFFLLALVTLKFTPRIIKLIGVKRKQIPVFISKHIVTAIVVVSSVF